MITDRLKIALRTPGRPADLVAEGKKNNDQEFN
jgi:hypothetical protein